MCPYIIGLLIYNLPSCAAFGLQKDHRAMHLLTLMTVEMLKMQFGTWMVCRHVFAISEF